MDFNYLMSILEVYLSKEKDSKTNLSIIKNEDGKIKCNFTMNDNKDTTSFFLLYDVFMENDSLKQFLNAYKTNLIIIDERYEYDRINETCYYYIVFSNGRILSFKNFKLDELNNIRNYIYNIDYHPDEIKIVLDEKKKMGYYHLPNLGETGFSGFVSIILIAIWFAIIFAVSLWICKTFI